MPTFQLQARTASGYDEVELLKSIYYGTKPVVHKALDTDSYPLDPQTGVAGTCVEVDLMDPRFDLILTVDAYETPERLKNAPDRAARIRDGLKAIAGARNKIGVWLNLGGHKFWSSTYDNSDVISETVSRWCITHDAERDGDSGLCLNFNRSMGNCQFVNAVPQE